MSGHFCGREKVVACRFRETNFGTATGKKDTKKQPRTRIQEQKTMLKLERLNS